MSRIYHYDTTWEQIGENDAVIGSAELRIFYTVTPPGGDGWNEPRYPAQAEFHSVSMEMPGGEYRELFPSQSTAMQAMADTTLYCWAREFIDDHNGELVEAADRRDEDNADYARDLRDEMRREMRGD